MRPAVIIALNYLVYFIWRNTLTSGTNAQIISTVVNGPECVVIRAETKSSPRVAQTSSKRNLVRAVKVASLDDSRSCTGSIRRDFVRANANVTLSGHRVNSKSASVVVATRTISHDSRWVSSL